MMRRFRWIHLLALPVLLSACGEHPGGDDLLTSGAAGDVDPASIALADQEVLPDTWFVELEEAPLLRGGSASLLVQQKVVFRAEAEKRGMKLEERFAFDRLWNGLSVKVAPGDYAELARIPGVKAIYPVVRIQKEDTPQDPGSQMDMMTAVAMTGADIAQSQLGLTGAKVRVGIIDSGIDYDHPDLGNGCFGDGCRVAFGYDFVGDDFNAATAGSLPVPDNDPDDCGGHGSHVAGIVGANGKIVGVAPGVTFGAYRVFGCTGSTSADIMVQAMERAQMDDMRVVNMSIGSGYQWPQYPTAVAASNLSAAGTIVTASGGNNGDKGVWAGGAPGVGDLVISAASADNTHVAQAAFDISPDGTKIGFNPGSPTVAIPTTGSLPMARTGTVSSTTDACTALPAGSLTGQIALIRRGGCTFYIKAANAQGAGASGVVLYNNTTGIITPSLTPPAGSPNVTIPVVSITQADGVTINTRMDAGTVTLTWTSDVISNPNPTASRLSAFSSFGPSPDLSFKPDVMAPGGSIYSTLPLEQNGGYGSQSGTSMAAPHTAGAVALLIEGTGLTDFESIRARLQNTAAPTTFFDPATGTNTGIYDSAHRQGAGLIHIDRAVTATSLILPSKISVGETTGAVTKTLTLRNDSPTPAVYEISHQPAVGTAYTYPAVVNGTAQPLSMSVTNAPSTVSFNTTSVTVPAGGTATVDVTITPNAQLADKGVFGGYVVFTQGTEVLRVPYVGFKGDYQSIVALNPTTNGFPWLTKVVNGQLAKQASGATYSLAGGDLPYVVVHLDHQVTRLKIDVVEAGALAKPWGTAQSSDYWGRNDTATGTYQLSWNGTTTMGKSKLTVPNGTYVLKLSVLKALGDEKNPAHWETWTSPPVTIER